jgi:hypothetical protein
MYQRTKVCTTVEKKNSNTTNLWFCFKVYSLYDGGVLSGDPLLPQLCDTARARRWAGVAALRRTNADRASVRNRCLAVSHRRFRPERTCLELFFIEPRKWLLGWDALLSPPYHFFSPRVVHTLVRWYIL